MKDEIRIFEAIGAADPSLVARSERRLNRCLLPRGFAAAACLAAALILAHCLPQRIIPGQGGNTSAIDTPAPSAENTVPPSHDPSGAETFLPSHGSEIGTLRLLSYAPQSPEKSADFLIYINAQQFYISEDKGLYSIRSTSPLPDSFPVCGLDILHLSGIAPTDAMESAKETLTQHYEEISHEEPYYSALPDSLYLRAGNGAGWNAEQTELWFVDDRQGGTFAITSRYFTEAEEGMGMCFRDMASSFRVISPSESIPEWMQSLQKTADRLFPALFANDLSAVTDLLAEDAAPDAYGEDVWSNLTIASVDYAPDRDEDPDSAIVSVKHRLNLEEGESFSYLTMKLIRRNGEWRLSWSGVEK